MCTFVERACAHRVSARVRPLSARSHPSVGSILECTELQNMGVARAMTYVEVFALSREHLMKAVESYPTAWKLVRATTHTRYRTRRAHSATRCPHEHRGAMGMQWKEFQRDCRGCCTSLTVD